MKNRAYSVIGGSRQVLRDGVLMKLESYSFEYIYSYTKL
jgi:hypothetical protein